MDAEEIARVQYAAVGDYIAKSVVYQKGAKWYANESREKTHDLFHGAHKSRNKYS